MPNHNAVPEPEQVDRELQVLDLRRAGLTWARIAAEVGYADHSGAYAAYKRAVTRTLQEPADQLRQAEVDRLDRLQLAIWPKAMRGDNAAIMTIVRIIDRRAKLLGLDMPIKIQQEVTVWEGGESIDRAVRELAELLRNNAAAGPGEGAMAGNPSAIEPITTGEQLADLDDPLGPGMGQDQNGVGMDRLRGDNQTEN